MEAGGVGTIVNASASVESWERVLELTRKYPFVYGMIGVHPDEVGGLDEEAFARMKRLLKDEKLVAVGEIGLDYYWDKEKHDLQKEWFVRQLALARQEGLPVNVHSRGGRGGYDGDSQRAWPGNGRDRTLLFLFTGDGRGIREDGVSHRGRRRGHI